MAQFIPFDQQRQQPSGPAGGFRDAYQRQAQPPQPQQPPGPPPPNAQQASLQAGSSFGMPRQSGGWANRMGQMGPRQMGGYNDMFQGLQQKQMMAQQQADAASRPGIMDGCGVQSPPPQQSSIRAIPSDPNAMANMQAQMMAQAQRPQEVDPRQAAARAMWGQRFGGFGGGGGRYIGF
jgi:hypothetical protein